MLFAGGIGGHVGCGKAVAAGSCPKLAIIGMPATPPGVPAGGPVGPIGRWKCAASMPHGLLAPAAAKGAGGAEGPPGTACCACGPGPALPAPGVPPLGVTPARNCLTLSLMPVVILLASDASA